MAFIRQEKLLLGRCSFHLGRGPCYHPTAAAELLRLRQRGCCGRLMLRRVLADCVHLVTFAWWRNQARVRDDPRRGASFDQNQLCCACLLGASPSRYAVVFMICRHFPLIELAAPGRYLDHVWRLWLLHD